MSESLESAIRRLATGERRGIFPPMSLPADAEQEPWAMNEYGQSKYCDGPGCRCEDMDADAAHRLNYRERTKR